jgi:hypothetical protein
MGGNTIERGPFTRRTFLKGGEGFIGPATQG